MTFGLAVAFTLLFSPALEQEAAVMLGFGALDVKPHALGGLSCSFSNVRSNSSA
jgi:hypothetical protein